MHSAFLTINQVPTKVTTWGKWVEETFDANDPKDIVLFIPGNPGVSSFYNNFLETIYKQRGWSVWMMGHAGHETPENEDLYSIPPLNGNHNLYNLEGQVKHQVEFIEKYVPDNIRIHLIGHSVGSYIITRLLKIPSINKKIVKSYLIFPTIEYIGDTPNGKWYQRVVQPLLFLILFFTYLFSLLPYIVRYYLVYIWTMVTGCDIMHIPTICRFVNSDVLGKVFFMASDEMVTMKAREDETIKANLNKIKIYFGKNDGWGPVSYYKKLKDDIPNIDAVVSKEEFSHAFVLRSSKQFGLVIADWLQN